MESRKTFTVPEGFYAVRDKDDRATGEVRPIAPTKVKAMKVYIAAKYRRRFELRAFAAALKSHGVEVTSHWLDNDDTEGPPAEAARMDLTDVGRADALIFIGEPQGSENTGGGRWLEMGYALAYGKRIIVVLGAEGPNEHIGSVLPRHETVFTALPEITCVDTLDEAMRLVI